MSNKTRTGWVYILVNESIPGQVKVGFTSGHPEDRASELHSSGVPTPYEVATAFLFVDNAFQIEQKAHQLLRDCRVNINREFFRCSGMDAADAIRRASEQLNEKPAKIHPVLLTEEKITERKRKEVEYRRIEEERIEKEQKLKGRPCERLYWTQIYTPYEGHGDAPYVELFEGKQTSKLIWCFSDCACNWCEKNRIYPYENPTDLKELHKDVIERFRINYDSGHIPENLTEGLGVEDAIDNLEAAFVAGLIKTYSELDQNSRSLFMERYRNTAANKEMLSEEEIKLVNYSEGMILIGVEWDIIKHCWKTSTYEGNWWKGYEIIERWFNCKEDAVSSFRENHREAKELLPPKISKFLCPCDTCRRAYLDKQRSVNQTKKSL